MATDVSFCKNPLVSNVLTDSSTVSGLLMSSLKAFCISVMCFYFSSSISLFQ